MGVGEGVAPGVAEFGSSVSPGSDAAGEKEVGTPSPAVGSNGIHPALSKYTSGHEWSWSLETVYTGSPSVRASPVSTPGRKPMTMREGMPSVRAMSANADA